MLSHKPISIFILLIIKVLLIGLNIGRLLEASFNGWLNTKKRHHISLGRDIRDRCVTYTIPHWAESAVWLTPYLTGPRSLCDLHHTSLGQDRCVTYTISHWAEIAVWLTPYLTGLRQRLRCHVFAWAMDEIDQTEHSVLWIEICG